MSALPIKKFYFQILLAKFFLPKNFDSKHLLPKAFAPHISSPKHFCPPVLFSSQNEILLAKSSPKVLPQNFLPRNLLPKELAPPKLAPQNFPLRKFASDKICSLYCPPKSIWVFSHNLLQIFASKIVCCPCSQRKIDPQIISCKRSFLLQYFILKISTAENLLP